MPLIAQTLRSRLEKGTDAKNDGSKEEKKADGNDYEDAAMRDVADEKALSPEQREMTQSNLF